MLVGLLTILPAEPWELPPITAVLYIKQVCSIGGASNAAHIPEIRLTIWAELQTSPRTSEEVVHSLASTSVRHTPTAAEVFVLSTVRDLNRKTVCLVYNIVIITLVHACLHT